MTEALNKAGRELYKKYCEQKIIVNEDWDRGHKKGIEDAMDILQKVYEEYHKLEKQGLFLRLPCKIGDTVYTTDEMYNKIREWEIVAVSIDRSGVFYKWKSTDKTGLHIGFKGFYISQLEATVFLTKAEAEEALKKMRGE